MLGNLCIPMKLALTAPVSLVGGVVVVSVSLAG